MKEINGTTKIDNGHTIDLKVKQLGKSTLVPPVEETKKSLYFLSNLEQNIAAIVRTIYSFKSEEKGNETSGKVSKEALGKVLVHYYPLARRLTISRQGKLIVDCTGEGAVFVEAEADCSMDEIGDATKPDPATLGTLVYDMPSAKNILEIRPLTAQAYAHIGAAPFFLANILGNNVLSYADVRIGWVDIGYYSGIEPMLDDDVKLLL
ncbi:hypothetical protein Cgig2_023893 [Carnegiea gigantea]|uniref:Uncharacterized protein n=1 Tax=Carnegiea gigantea TaxID=171969 RepID=A0A9Q1JLL1_9CARY|nr:hypothetical protein Cgig2_023893 [Carnegiea gigantea]